MPFVENFECVRGTACVSTTSATSNVKNQQIWLKNTSVEFSYLVVQAADSNLYGTSPKGSFNHEMMHWMEVCLSAM